MAICKLCQKNYNLVNSHIIPKFLHKKIDPHTNKILIIYENLKKSLTNDMGIKEYLLCEHCDNVIISRYESYFNKIWYQNSILPNSLNHKDRLYLDIDYDLFLLFHLSIFWRMSISNHHTFRNIYFGKKHNEEIRKILLSGNTSNNHYKILVKLIIKDKQPLNDIIKQPINHRIDSHTFYSAIYGQSEITIKISSHECKEFDELTLSEENKYIWVVDYREVTQIIEIFNILNRIKNDKKATHSKIK